MYLISRIQPHARSRWLALVLFSANPQGLLLWRGILDRTHTVFNGPRVGLVRRFVLVIWENTAPMLIIGNFGPSTQQLCPRSGMIGILRDLVNIAGPLCPDSAPIRPI